MEIGDKVSIVANNINIPGQGNYTGKSGVIQVWDTFPDGRTMYKIKVQEAQIFLWKDSISPYISKCTCGAKFTSRPTYHLNYCEEN